jgi:hypothetical protein
LVSPSPTPDYREFLLSDSCIKAFEQYAYVFPEEGLDESVPPLPPWEIAGALPAHPEGWAWSHIAATRTYLNQTEIWVRRHGSPIYLQPYFDSFREFLIFRPGPRSWETVSAELDRKDLYVGDLFVTSDGQIWGQNIWYFGYDEPTVEALPLLSRFNESTRRFEFGPNVLEIPLFIEDSSSWDGIDVVLDRNDVFWIFVAHQALFSYDTADHTLKRQHELPGQDVFHSIVASDGQIAFRSYGDPDDMLSIYYPDEDRLEHVEIPDFFQRNINGMAFDLQDNLWLGAGGYRDPLGAWHIINPEFEDLIDSRPTDRWSVWGRAGLILATSDGRLWFMRWADTAWIFQGNAWYDPASGTGCMFSTTTSKILEGPKGNVWLVANRSLYQLALDSKD